MPLDENFVLASGSESGVTTPEIFGGISEGILQYGFFQSEWNRQFCSILVHRRRSIGKLSVWKRRASLRLSRLDILGRRMVSLLTIVIFVVHNFPMFGFLFVSDPVS